MQPNVELVNRLSELLGEVFGTEIESPELDLIEAGVLDSLAVAEILVRVEEEFEVMVPMEELEIDDLRTVRGIAEFLTTKCGLGTPW